jgi:superfamily II DNA or RNA helicase
LTNLEDIQQDLRVAGVIPGESVRVLGVQQQGPDAIAVTYEAADGSLGRRVLGRDAEDSVSIVAAAARPLDADAQSYKLVAECQRIRLAGLADPMLAVTTSDIQPLPHQLRAVYGPLIEGRPLRFLLADDPGAGKTIMAGLYIKELLLREDVKRCLIVAPGGLVEQWQDELFLKFGLAFTILERGFGETVFGASAFGQHPLLIARMDQLSRSEELLAGLQESEWDLVVVDEAHRMAAHYFGGELKKTKRFLLGEILGDLARHFLLMTATPHNGKEEDFQLFLTLLDRDRFEGKYSEKIHAADTSGLMRRMVKEDLLTFEGKPLFPDRIAQTVPYRLSPLEQDLYEQVTAYVREGMNRADQLDGKRRNTVGFALTVLQRRLASSPEAILRSLERRADRLGRRKQAVLSGNVPKGPDLGGVDLGDYDDEEYTGSEVEDIEEELVDAATAARTVEELDLEIADLRVLIASAAKVRAAETDRKWGELRTILEDNTLEKGADGSKRKLIVFTEHRDTLDYLQRRIGSLLGKPDAVRSIHGGVRRNDRRQITQEFTSNPDCQILLATDAAGEGLNLQVAHLMVNYDLPWNPNRIEQRFGRIHRIGQQEVCRLWNLVAEDTREGEVFLRLLEKMDEQRAAYGGKLFDVLGNAFAETPLRTLLIDAIRSGELPETRARMHRVVDETIAEGIQETLAERALATEALQTADLATLKAMMDEARARRLQPHYIEAAFRAAFARLGGKIRKRETGRFEITQVPASLRAPGTGPIATKYERVTFDTQHVQPDGVPRAELLAPGHPLHDAVTQQIVRDGQGTLDRGTVLVSDELTEPKLLVGVIQEIADATETSVAKRFGYAYIGADGSIEGAGPAPYLDCVGAPVTPETQAARDMPWLAEAEDRAAEWITSHRLPRFLEEVRLRRTTELERVRTQVDKRLYLEAERLTMDSLVAADAVKRGKKPKESEAALLNRAADLEARRTARLALLDRQLEMHPRPPRVVTAALILPAAAVVADSEEPPPEEPADVDEMSNEEVERRAVDRAMAEERKLGRFPEEMEHWNEGFDIRSRTSEGDSIWIEVKGRIAGADEFHVTRSEVLQGWNTRPRHRLALVRVHPDGPDHDEIRYVGDAFANTVIDEFEVTRVTYKWKTMWDRGQAPF